jgi:hypothetical protein
MSIMYYETLGWGDKKVMQGVYICSKPRAEWVINQSERVGYEKEEPQEQKWDQILFHLCGKFGPQMTLEFVKGHTNIYVNHILGCCKNFKCNPKDAHLMFC